MSRYHHLRGLAKKRNITVKLTKEQYIALAALPCTYCGGPLPFHGHGLDRADNTEGYTPENCVPCCTLCNKVKADLFSYEEMQLIGPVLTVIQRHRLRKSLPKGA